MKKLLYIALAAVCAGCCCCRLFDGPDFTAVSPDGKNEIRLWTKPLAYEVVREGVVVVGKTEIGMKIDGTCLCEMGKGPKAVTQIVSGVQQMPVYKKNAINLSANETFVDWNLWGVRLVARNDGVAYRFETNLPRTFKVTCEKAGVTIPCKEAVCSLNYGSRPGCEETVPLSCKADEIKTGTAQEKFVYLPFVYTINGKSVAVTESDLADYPIWNLVRNDDGCCGVSLGSTFAKWPTKLKNNDGEELGKNARRQRHWKVAETADWLVETEGKRTFPWRTFVLVDHPSKFCEADIVTALARPAEKGSDFSWVKPGKVAWDWWNCWDNLGEAKGCTTKGYERFIDFAAKTGVEYVIFDEGWSEKLNIWKFHPNVDVPHLIDYAAKKGVGIILWMAWAQVVGEEERVAEHFAKLGAKGFKVDFMDRGDAQVEGFLWKFAAACAKHKMLIDYHGAHRPTGMSRAYPNVLNYEAIHGLETMKWYQNGACDMMDNDVKAFFLRLTAGPMDYTPGAMDNYPVGGYPKTVGKGAARNTYVNPGSVGTRCRQMAMMVLYEAPLQMLSDSPTKYERNMESFAFMAATPVVWADTIGLGGCPDSMVAVARKAKDGSWYAAGMTNAKQRDFVLDTSFLGEGEWKVEAFHDATDSNVAPTHYVHERGNTIKSGTKLIYRMAPGGGFVVRFSK